MNETVLEYLKKLAETQSHIASYEFDDLYGSGNYKDAYRAGTDDGEIWLARKVLTDLGIPFKKS